MTTQVMKAKKLVDKMYAKACKERDKKGYRENLGYDQEIKLRDSAVFQSLHYTEQCDVKDYFYAMMGKV